jgi:predicted enzyme related to lactoylglutathione lyase
MTPRFVLTLDCSDVERQAAFWCAAVGYERSGGGGPYTALDHPDGSVPRLLLQLVPEAKSAKNRLHIDLHVDDIAGEADRLAALGATHVEHVHESGTEWFVMTDPEGNEFCVCPSLPSVASPN